MHIRRNLHDAVTIQQELVFQNALTELLETEVTADRCYKKHGEKSDKWKLAQAANEAAWETLVGVIDTYCARRIHEAVSL